MSARIEPKPPAHERLWIALGIFGALCFVALVGFLASRGDDEKGRARRDSRGVEDSSQPRSALAVEAPREPDTTPRFAPDNFDLTMSWVHEQLRDLANNTTNDVAVRRIKEAIRKESQARRGTRVRWDVPVWTVRFAEGDDKKVEVAFAEVGHPISSSEYTEELNRAATLGVFRASAYPYTGKKVRFRDGPQGRGTLLGDSRHAAGLRSGAPCSIEAAWDGLTWDVNASPTTSGQAMITFAVTLWLREGRLMASP